MAKKNTTKNTTKERPYQSSHSWITFSADVRHAPIGLWMNLGAVQSKCKHIANTLLPPDVSNELCEVYLAKGIRATTAIEGNTLSELEVREIIQGGGHIPKSREYQKREVSNVLNACNSIAIQVVDDSVPPDLTVDGIKDFNRKVLDGLELKDDGIVPGEISHHNVVAGHYRGAPRQDCEYLLGRLCDWINKEIVAPSREMRIAFSTIKAVLAHLYLAWIHPFGDGNGRTARLIELQILLGAGVPVPSAHLLSNHYNQTRDEYYRQLDKASKSGGNIVPFLEYAIQGFVDGLDEQIDRIDRCQWSATWKEFVSSSFKDLDGKAAKRQKQIALDLWDADPNGVPKAKIWTLSPEVAILCGGVSPRSIERDLKQLETMGLIQQARTTVKVNFRTLSQLLPPMRKTV